MIFASLLARLGFDTTDWSAGAMRAKEQLKGLEGAVNSAMRGIKNTLGRNSLLGQLGKAFAAAGAISGLKTMINDINSLADRYIGAAKAAKEAETATANLWASQKSADEAIKTAKEWELDMAKKLTKAYRELDTAKNPEHKRANELDNELDEQASELDKKKREITATEKAIKDARERSTFASNQLKPIEDQKKQYADNVKIAMTPGAAIDSTLQKLAFEHDTKDRESALEATIDKEQETIREGLQRLIILKAEFAQQEIEAEMLKNATIEKSDTEATEETRKKMEKEMEERRKIQEKAADDYVKLQKETVEKQISNLELQKRDIELNKPEGGESHHYQAAQTEAIRNATMRVVIATPQITDPQKEAAKRAEGLLRAIDKHIQELNKQKSALVEVPG